MSTPSNKVDKLKLNINYLRNKYYTLFFLVIPVMDSISLKGPEAGQLIETYNSWFCYLDLNTRQDQTAYRSIKIKLF